MLLSSVCSLLLRCWTVSWLGSRRIVAPSEWWPLSWKTQKVSISLGASKWNLCEFMQHFLQPKNYAKCWAMHANTKKVDTDLFQQRIIFISKFNSSAYACLDNNWKKHGRHPIIAVLVLQVQALCPPLWHECSHDRTGLRVWNSNRCLLEDYDLLLQSSKRKMNDMNASNGIYHIIYYPRY